MTGGHRTFKAPKIDGAAAEERKVATLDEADKSVPEIDKDEIIVAKRQGAKGKGKQTSDTDDLAAEETERIGMDIESVAWNGETTPSSSQPRPVSDSDDVNLSPSQIGQRKQITTTKALSVVSENRENVEQVNEDQEYTALVLRDPVKVRRHDYMTRDTVAFLLNYPNHVDDPESTANLRFYNNEIRFRPYGLLIDAFHTRAFRRYKLLEQHHGYSFLRYFANREVHPMALSDSRTRSKSSFIPSSDP
jgi:hypothetical protein